MPKVGKMKFPYTEQGIKEAANYAKNSGKPMQVEGNYRHGGMVPNRPIPRPTPGTGMTPPVNPGIYRNGGMVPNQPINPRFRYGFGSGGTNPAQKRALMNRLAKFKKGIV